MKRARRLSVLGLLSIPFLLALLAIAGVMFLRQGGFEPWRVPQGGDDVVATPERIERGRYLAQLGNCLGCHTRQGGAPLAGGRRFATDYGDVYSSNLTPDPVAGIGDWSAAEFRHAMRHGVSRNGVLSPVFPYASFRHLDDGDLDAIFAFLRQVEPAPDANLAPRYEFPASLPGAMTAWRLLYYRPAPGFAPEARDAQRGAYLVEGIGHCGTCHRARGTHASQVADGSFAGARVAGWLAPALDAQSLQHYAPGELARYLRGQAVADRASYGLMADVIGGNLQYLGAEDAEAIEAHLRRLPPPHAVDAPAQTVRASADLLSTGREVYRKHCADCHGERGEGVAGEAPALTTSTAVRASDPINLIKLVLFGAVAPSTPAHPRPPTMPPFAHQLTTREITALVNALRTSADSGARAISEAEVQALGGIGSPQ